MLTSLARAALRRICRERSPIEVRIGRTIQTGRVDAVAVHSDRVLSVMGSARDLSAFRDGLTLVIAGQPVAPSHAFRVPRGDAAEALMGGGHFSGAVVEWILPDAAHRPRLEAEGQVLAELDVPAGEAPAYHHLRTSSSIDHREHIYGSGPPVHEVAPDTLALARGLPAPILDFGCGGGALIRALRAEGIETYGLELDRPAIRTHLLPEAAPFVTLYDGQGPAPFDDRRFASVACCEVLEHIPNPLAAVAELARLGTDRLLITVPDMSSIPRGFRHGVVPWHLLEATHVNFFTQHSLESALAPYAERIEMSRICLVRCGPLTYYTSLAATVVLKPEAGEGPQPPFA